MLCKAERERSDSKIVGLSFLRNNENWTSSGKSQFFRYISKSGMGSQLKVAIHNKEGLECILQRMFH